MSDLKRPPAEGDLYDVFEVAGHIIPVYYGYMDAEDKITERTSGENLVPVTPDFLKNPLYAADGSPLVTDIQDPCAFYEPDEPAEPEDWCRDCVFFPSDKPKIGVCRCKKLRKQ